MPVPTPFHERTAALCTSYRWKEWAGYLSVCSYDTCHVPEYFAFRHAAGLLDVSPLKKYEITGPDAGRFLAYVMARDITRLQVGRVTYTCLCDQAGKVIDDGTVARLGENRYRVTTASPAYWWFDRHSRGFTIEIEDVSHGLAAVAIQGPTSRAVLENALDADLDLGFFRVAAARIAGVSVEISRTGYTGDLGYEVWVAADDAVELWDALTSAGRPHGLLPAGLDALDITRIEAGFVLQNVDYFSAPDQVLERRKSSPFEVGLGWTVQLDRDPFLGQAALRAERERGSEWALVGLEIDWEEVERLFDSYDLPPHLPSAAWRTAIPVYQGGRQVGQATSGAWSPTLKRNLALASVPADLGKVGTRLQIEQTVEYERKQVTATVVDRPFFDPERKRA